MAPAPDETLPTHDPALEGGEWLFRRAGEVFGPVDSRTLAAMLYRGDIDGGTPVSAGDGQWRPVGELPLFLVHAKKAEAALRVEREVTGARLLRARKSRRKAAVIAVAAALLVVGAILGAFVLARRGAETSPLLEDFGAGIRIASAARVGVSERAAAEDEIEVPVDAQPSPGEPRAAPRREKVGRVAQPAGSGAPAGQVAGGELVAAQFDARRIQAVVAREQRSLVPCFREEAARSPEFQGDVPIEFAIGNDGRVATLWIDEPRLRDGALKGCLTRALAGWRFDPFPGQRPTVSLAFRIGR
jgi:GYF domain 2